MKTIVAHFECNDSTAVLIKGYICDWNMHKVVKE